MPKRRWMIVVSLVALAGVATAFVMLDLGRFLSFDAVKSSQADLARAYAERPVVFLAGFFALYVAAAALSLPGALLLTLLAGALFGVGIGTVLVSFASTAGATLAFLAARTLFRDAVRRRAGPRMAAIDRGVARDGALYLLTLRLVPIFPFFLVNPVMGLTPLRVRTFWWASQLGMLPATALYVNAGTQLARLESASGILSPMVLGSLAALGLLPLLGRWLADTLSSRRAYARWRAVRPRRFDRNLIVIGGGSAGLVTAYIAAAVRAQVTLIERDRMGGDCLNTGCVPSKALLRTAKLLAQARDSAALGIRSMRADYDFADVMECVQRVVADIAPHDSIERYRGLGVDCVTGRARLVTPWQVEIATEGGGTRTLTARNIVIATGARPVVPAIPGIQDAGCLTSETVWGLRERPGRLLVLGGGPIGCELALAFARLGSHVVLVEMAPRLLVREDDDVSAFVQARLAEEGIELRCGHRALRFESDGGARKMVADTAAGPVEIAYDTLLCALGRRANTDGLGLEALGIRVAASGVIETDAWLRSSLPNVLACGDVAGPYQYTHAAAHMAWHAAVNALFGRLRRFPVDWSVLPACTFLDPEVARVGLNEQEARERGIAADVTRYDIADLDRAIAEGAARGFVKVLTAPGSDRVLGATIVGEHAGELITEYVAAMKHGFGMNRILGTIHAYPTMAEANKYAAGEWKKARKPERLLGWVERFHRWERGGQAPTAAVAAPGRVSP